MSETTTASRPAKYKFRLRAGSHIERGIKNPDGTDRIFSVGEVFESDVDRTAQHGEDKFERLSAQIPNGQVLISAEELERLRALDKPSTTSSASPQFDKMTDKELRSYADTAEIDVTRCKTRDDLLKAIKGS